MCLGWQGHEKCVSGWYFLFNIEYGYCFYLFLFSSVIYIKIIHSGSEVCPTLFMLCIKGT